MLPSSNDYSSSKSLISSTSSLSSPGQQASWNSQQLESDVTAETSLAQSEPVSAFKLEPSGPKPVNTSETSYPSSSASSSRGLSSSESCSGEHRHRHHHHHHHSHHHGQKSKQLRKIKPDAHSTATTSSSSSSDSGSISPCASSISSTSSLNESQPRDDNNLNYLYEKRGDGGGSDGKRFKLFNFLKIKPSGMTKSKTVDQIKCICRDEKKFDCLKCTSNYPVHVNRSKDGEEDRGRSFKLPRHDQQHVVASSTPANQRSVLNTMNSANQQPRTPLVVSVPVRRSADGNNSNGHNHNHNHNRMTAARRTMPELQEHQSMPNSKTFSNFSSLNPVPNASSSSSAAAIKLKPSPFPVSNQLMSFLEQLNPSNSFKVPPNVSPFT